MCGCFAVNYYPIPMGHHRTIVGLALHCESTCTCSRLLSPEPVTSQPTVLIHAILQLQHAAHMPVAITLLHTRSCKMLLTGQGDLLCQRLCAGTRGISFILCGDVNSHMQHCLFTKHVLQDGTRHMRLCIYMSCCKKSREGQGLDVWQL